MHVGIVHGNTERMSRSRPCGKQYNVGLEQDSFSSCLLYLHTPTGKQARTTAEPLDAVTQQVALDSLGHKIRDLKLSRHEQPPRILYAHWRRASRALAKAGEVDGSFSQSLSRDSGRAYCDTTWPRIGIDDGDALSEVCGLGRSLLAGRACTQHDEVMLCRHACVGLTKAGFRSCRIMVAHREPKGPRRACHACSQRRSRRKEPAPSPCSRPRA